MDYEKQYLFLKNRIDALIDISRKEKAKETTKELEKLSHELSMGIKLFLTAKVIFKQKFGYNNYCAKIEATNFLNKFPTGMLAELQESEDTDLLDFFGDLIPEDYDAI